MKLLCIGDVAIGDSDISRLVLSPPNGMTPNKEEKVLFNWELPVGTVVNSTPRVRGPRLLAHPDSPDVIKKWAPSYATLANNHVLDAEIEGLKNTKVSLNNLGISTVGAGINEEEIKEPLIWETSQGRLAILNWVFTETHPDWMAVPGPNCWPGIREAGKIIRTLKNQVDWVMVVGHWSDEHFPYPLPLDREIARGLVDAGVDIIIGQHPHVVRGFEMINGCPVYYSVGNYYFSTFSDNAGKRITSQAPRYREGLGVEVSFKRGKSPEHRVFSFWRKRDCVIQDPLRRAARRMKSVSRPLQQFDESGYDDWYKKKRSRFNVWGYRLHFGLWKLDKKKIVQIMRRIILRSST